MNYPNKEKKVSEAKTKEEEQIRTINNYIDSESIEEFMINENLKGNDLSNDTVHALCILYNRINKTYSFSNLIKISLLLFLTTSILSFFILPFGWILSSLLSAVIFIFFVLIEAIIISYVVSVDNDQLAQLKHIVYNNSGKIHRTKEYDNYGCSFCDMIIGHMYYQTTLMKVIDIIF